MLTRATAIPKPLPGRVWQQQVSKLNSSNTNKKNSLLSGGGKKQGQADFLFPSSGVTKRVQATANFRETEAAVKQYEEEQANSRNFYSLPEIDFPLHAGIPPVMSATQAHILYDVHHRGIVKRLNDLAFGTIYEAHPLDSVILATSFDAENAALHTAACEHWNHSFAWRSLLPFGSAPSSALRNTLGTASLKQLSRPCFTEINTLSLDERAASTSANTTSSSTEISGFDRCKRLLADACHDAVAAGGGWVFLVAPGADSQSFEVARYRPGTSPIASGVIPLLGLNLQYHARYVDLQQQDGGGDEDQVHLYVENLIKAINWSRVNLLEELRKTE